MAANRVDIFQIRAEPLEQKTDSPEKDALAGVRINLGGRTFALAPLAFAGISLSAALV